MAGTSSSSGGSRKYQVFINFRGADTRRCFVCHLYNALDQNGLETFIDSEDLQKGDSLSELLKAVKDSKISIVVFSKDYASSTWCLKELVQILECMDQQRQIVVPIFYDVDPSDGRELKGRFAEALAKHESDPKFDNDEVKSWKSGLTKATSLSGWVSKNYEDDHKLIKSIVDDILEKLNRISPSKTDGLIGMDFHMNKIDSLWKQGKDDCGVVGIWGMGGLGKSTIARAVYGKIGAQFTHKCFLDNVKEGFLTKNSELQLVEELLCKALNRKDRGNSIESLNMMRESLRRKKVLLVLDDVDDVDQIVTLIGISPSDSFSGGSRIIITTRDKKLLAGFMIYQPELFNPEEALELFCRYAFRTVKFSERYGAISIRAVKYAHGLPLALTVLGALLDNRTEQEWEKELKKIDKIPITSLDSKIGRVLWASYDGLHELEKNIFLDVACFFRGEPIEMVTYFLESSEFFPDIGLKVLVEKSLLTVSDGVLNMHDLIQEMGRNIVRKESIEEPEGRSRLWYHEDVVEVLAQNTGTSAVEGIILDLSKINDELFVNTEAFVGMKRLRMLQIGVRKNLYEYDRSTSDGECKQHSLQNLVIVDLSNSKDLIRTPDFSQAKKLKTLRLKGCTSLFEVDPSLSAVGSLVMLDLSGCSNLVRFPSISGNMKELKYLFLNSTAITEIPSSINDLPALYEFLLCDCSELISLPSIIHMKSVGALLLNGCSKLEKFPEISGVMRSLWELKLDGSAIKQLPSSINHLTLLFKLSMRNCTSLVCLPEEICNVEFLDLTGCSKVEKLPENLGNSMSNLCDIDDGRFNLVLDGSAIKQLPFSILRIYKVSCKGCKEMSAPFSSWPTWNHQTSSDNVLYRFDLSDCNLLELSDAIAHLSSLKDLNLSGNDKLESLPATMSRLGCLKELRLEGCKRLKSIPELSPSIKFIYANNCTSLVTVSTPQLPCAKACGLFQFFNCSKLVNTNQFIEIVESVIDNQESLEVNDHEYGYHCMYLPGSDIPDWFDHQSRGSSVTVQLPPDGFTNKFQGLAICAIINLRDAGNREILESALCCAILKTTVGQTRFYFRLFPEPHHSLETDTPLESDHMFLGCYHSSIYIDSGGTDATFKIVTTSDPRVGHSDYFIPGDSMTWEDCMWITSCGVRLFFGSKAPSSLPICNLENRDT
ncbi:disease resistance-like protein DSC1 isoform X2 [Argentina anserina]|uniref:disease resistance-like protein DSC1 isoform X2 n=1 Tax=Argentina anserina TaxID=57926 RepID=UPI00217653C8|nr:disease resistance-like protein DSC1 isoform X2 [Potentilla anserina]